MKKFEMVKKDLEDSTRNTSNFVTVTKNVNASHTGKYAIQNVITRNISSISYKTLDAIIKEYNLNI